MTIRAPRQPLSLRLTLAASLTLWCLIAAFPIFWITVMSFNVPLDAFAASPWDVILGPITRAQGKGLTILDIAALIAFLITAARVAMGLLPRLVTRFSPRGLLAFGWLVGAAVFALTFLIGGLLVLLPLMCALNGAFGLTPLIGLTLEHYNTVWVDREFWRNFLTSLKVTVGVVTISLTFGTLAGYALARSGSTLVLDGSDQTMVPAIAGYFNRETTTTDQVQADAAAVSITAPLFLLVMTFQRQIVSGLTAGAVKG